MNIKGDHQIDGPLTAYGIEYPAAGALGETITSVATAVLESRDPGPAFGTIFADPAPAMEGNYSLNSNPGAFDFTLPPSGTDGTRIRLYTRNSMSNPVTVKPQTGETLSGVVNGTFTVDKTNSVYEAVDNGGWEIIKIADNYDTTEGPKPVQPSTSYAAGDIYLTSNGDLFLVQTPFVSGADENSLSLYSRGTVLEPSFIMQDQANVTFPGQAITSTANTKVKLFAASPTFKMTRGFELGPIMSDPEDEVPIPTDTRLKISGSIGTGTPGDVINFALHGFSTNWFAVDSWSATIQSDGFAYFSRVFPNTDKTIMRIVIAMDPGQAMTFDTWRGFSVTGVIGE